MTRVRLKETVFVWTVLREYETNHGPRLALGDETGVVCAAMPRENVEEVPC